MIRWLGHLIQKVENLGVSAGDGPDVYRVILSNRVAVLCFFLACPYLIIFSYFKLKLATIMVLPTQLIFILILFLNKRKQHTVAAVLTILGLSTIVLFYSVHLGFNSGAHLLFFPIAAWPFVLFSPQRKRLKWGCFFLVLFCILLTQFLRIHYADFDEVVLSYQVGKWIYFCACMTTLSFVTASMVLLYEAEKSAKRALVLANKKLEVALSFQKSDIDMAKKLQKEYLTKIPTAYPDYKTVTFKTFYAAAKKLSGDYYVADKNQHLFRYGLMDITGKGIEAALTMVHIHTIMSPMFHRKKPLGLNIAMAKINNHICKIPAHKKGCDLFLFELDLNSLKLTYCNAGLETAYLIHHQEVTQFDTHGTKLGFESGEHYRVEICKLVKGDILFLCTDGFIDMTKKNSRARYGHQRLERFLSSKVWTAASLKKAVTSEMRHYHGAVPVNDDCTFLIVEIS